VSCVDSEKLKFTNLPNSNFLANQKIIDLTITFMSRKKKNAKMKTDFSDDSVTLYGNFSFFIDFSSEVLFTIVIVNR
jgi:hypothetical protein